MEGKEDKYLQGNISPMYTQATGPQERLKAAASAYTIAIAAAPEDDTDAALGSGGCVATIMAMISMNVPIAAAPPMKAVLRPMRSDRRVTKAKTDRTFTTPKKLATRVLLFPAPTVAKICGA